MVPVMRSTTPSTAASSASGGRMSMTSYSRIPPPLVFAAPCGEQEWTRAVYRPGPSLRPDPSRGLRQKSGQGPAALWRCASQLPQPVWGGGWGGVAPPQFLGVHFPDVGDV